MATEVRTTDFIAFYCQRKLCQNVFGGFFCTYKVQSLKKHGAYIVISSRDHSKSITHLHVQATVPSDEAKY